MTKRAIKFQVTGDWNDGKVHVNTETGVEIYKSGAFYVDYPTLNAVVPSWTEGPFPTFAAARTAAGAIVERHREEIAAAFVEAQEEDARRSAPAAVSPALAPAPAQRTPFAAVKPGGVVSYFQTILEMCAYTLEGDSRWAMNFARGEWVEL